ncbi:MAG: hypothetical protein ICV66_00150 [Chitinophagaceae bacterium]|nr:hypothetical protein [Chitinophagaceae bacterium]
MDKDLEHISVDFHNRAKNLFFSLFRDFNASIERVDRNRDEYMFKQQREKYVNRLQQQLLMIAKETITKNQAHQNIGQLSQNLNHFIADYIHLFVQKVKAL